MRLYIGDTIAAISTPVGEGGIGIIRLSGDEAIAIAEKIIRRKAGRSGKIGSDGALKGRPSHSMFLALVIDPADNSIVDEALVSVMRAPNTYTKEDVVEINCHGGNVAVRKTLGLILGAGARAAEPGEFTRRAFLNGRIDLTQAEAVIDTIKSKTEAALKAAADQLEGGLSKNINAAAEEVANVLTQVEAAVDFSDEDIEVLPAEALLERLAAVRFELEELLQTALRGKMLKEGIKAAIIGRPNVGKSSLLNALLRTERAIVTPIPGTTRDVIEESINIKGVPLILKDTAGIRDSEDQVEKIGVELTKKVIKTADIVLCVLDSSQELSVEDKVLLEQVKGDATILVLNKSDLPQAIAAGFGAPEKDRRDGNGSGFAHCVKISALSGAGIQDLEDKIAELIFAGEVSSAGNTIITNARHEQLVKKALDELNEAADLIAAGQPEEIAAMLLREALGSLGEITGETIGEDVLGRIFSQFCIGK